MMNFGQLLQTADWKQEKHVPAIDAPEAVKKDEAVDIKVTVGKEIPHPNKTEHHIMWIELFFLADGEKFPWQIARAEFLAHGESTKGPDTSTVNSYPSLTVKFKTGVPGTLYSLSYCNIHGLWTDARVISVK